MIYTAAQIYTLAQDLGVSVAVATDILYLRTRARHTPEREQELIDADKRGYPIPTRDVRNGTWPYDRKPGEEIERALAELEQSRTNPSN